MSIFNSRKNQSADAAAPAKEERKNSEFWINIGYTVETTDDAGNKVKVFIALNRGIPMDDIEMLDESRSGNFGAMNQAANQLLLDLRNGTKDLAPGEALIVAGTADALEVQVRRIRDKTVASTDPAKNPFIRR